MVARLGRAVEVALHVLAQLHACSFCGDVSQCDILFPCLVFSGLFAQCLAISGPCPCMMIHL